MNSHRPLSRLRVGDVVAIVNLWGRQLATVTAVSRQGFAVGRRQYHFDGRGSNHSESIVSFPEPQELLQLRQQHSSPGSCVA